MAHDLYFMIQVEVFLNYILAENIYFTNLRKLTERKIMVLKPTIKYHIEKWYNYNFTIIVMPQEKIMSSKVFLLSYSLKYLLKNLNV